MISRMGGGTIQEWWLKRKAFLDSGAGEWGMYTLVALLAVAAFGLGRLSALVEAKPLVSVAQAGAAAGSPTALIPGGYVVASRSGSTYFYPWCSGAAQIKPANQRWFPTESAAKQAGYRPSKSCKGLVVE